MLIQTEKDKNGRKIKLAMAFRHHIVITVLFVWLFLAYGCTSAPNRMHEAKNKTVLDHYPQSVSRQTFRWQWVLTDGENLGEPSDYEQELGTKLDVIGVDFEIEEETVAAFREADIEVICQISVGTYEEWRDDLEVDDDDIVEAPLNSGVPYSVDDVLGLYDDEFFIDIGAFELDSNSPSGYRISYTDHTKAEVDGLQYIMRDRIKIAADKNCSAVEFDNMEIHAVDEEKYNAYPSKTGGNNTGRPDEGNQVAYVLWLSEVAHAYGLEVVLKNSDDILDYEVKADGRPPVGLMDFVKAIYVIVEECHFWGSCSRYQRLGEKYDTKILAVEYSDLLKKMEIVTKDHACEQFNKMDRLYVLIKDNRELISDMQDYYPCDR